MAHGMTRRHLRSLRVRRASPPLVSATGAGRRPKDLRLIMRKRLPLFLDPMWTTAYARAITPTWCSTTLFALDSKFSRTPDGRRLQHLADSCFSFTLRDELNFTTGSGPRGRLRSSLKPLDGTRLSRPDLANVIDEMTGPTIKTSRSD